MVCLGGVTTLSFDRGLAGFVSTGLCRHRSIAATEQASAGQPYRNRNGQKQADDFERDQKTHRHQKSTAQRCFCRDWNRPD